MRKTQKERVLDYLENNGTITSRQCMLELNIMDLQKAIQLLRNDGYRITDEWKTNESIYGITKFKQYKLEVE